MRNHFTRMYKGETSSYNIAPKLFMVVLLTIKFLVLMKQNCMNYFIDITVPFFSFFLFKKKWKKIKKRKDSYVDKNINISVSSLFLPYIQYNYKKDENVHRYEVRVLTSFFKSLIPLSEVTAFPTIIAIVVTLSRS